MEKDGTQSMTLCFTFLNFFLLKVKKRWQKAKLYIITKNLSKKEKNYHQELWAKNSTQLRVYSFQNQTICTNWTSNFLLKRNEQVIRIYIYWVGRCVFFLWVGSLATSFCLKPPHNILKCVKPEIMISIENQSSFFFFFPRMHVLLEY